MGMRTMDYTREQNVIQWFIELWHVGRVRANPNEFCDAICRSSFEISADFLFFFLLHSKIYSNSTRKAVLIASENGQRIWNVCVCVCLACGQGNADDARYSLFYWKNKLMFEREIKHRWRQSLPMKRGAWTLDNSFFDELMKMANVRPN